MENPAGKNKAIIAYLTIIGLFIAMSMNSDTKNDFATHHIKNMFGLTFIWIASQVITAYINPYFGDALWALTVIGLVYSLARAYKGKPPNIPFISKKTQQWFTFLD